MDLRWTESMATGVEAIDAQNQSFIFVLNGLFASGTPCESKSQTCQKIEQSIRFLVRSFGREEAIMTASIYPDRHRHKEEHRALLVDLQAMKHSYICGRYDATAVFERLGTWTARHLEEWDKPLGAHLRGATGRGPAASSASVRTEAEACA